MMSNSGTMFWIRSFGQVAPVDKAIVSGAKYVTPYKGRFVFYGFPEKPEAYCSIIKAEAVYE